MSFELRLSRKCDHRLFRQIRRFDSDRKTVRLGTLLGSASNFQVKVNGHSAPASHPVVGWTLVKDETSVDKGQKKLVFNAKRKALDDWVELTYFTHPDTCPKCLGVDVLFDIEYSNIGRPLTIVDESKLTQDIEKIILTVKGSSLYYPWYGTDLVALIGNKEPKNLVRLQIQRDLSNALANLKALQTQQEAFQSVSDREFLFQVDSILVEESSDPTLFRAKVKVTTQAGGKAEFSRDLRFDRSFFNTDLQEISRRVVR